MADVTNIRFRMFSAHAAGCGHWTDRLKWKKKKKTGKLWESSDIRNKKTEGGKEMLLLQDKTGIGTSTTFDPENDLSFHLFHT